jgi:hypothetical protein
VSGHPSWCDPGRCTAHRAAGVHRGAVRRVGDRSSQWASGWLERTPGNSTRAQFTASAGLVGFAPEELERVLALGAGLLAELRREP